MFEIDCNILFGFIQSGVDPNLFFFPLFFGAVGKLKNKLFMQL